jgi:hypothetical protein
MAQGSYARIASGMNLAQRAQYDERTAVLQRLVIQRLQYSWRAGVWDVLISCEGDRLQTVYAPQPVPEMSYLAWAHHRMYEITGFEPGYKTGYTTEPRRLSCAEAATLRDSIVLAERPVPLRP